MQTYSPWLNRFETDANSEFTLDFPMGDPFTTLAPFNVASGATASVSTGGLDPITAYEWQVTVTNGSGKSRTGPVWRFTTGTGGPVNQPPVAGSQNIGTPEDTPLAITLAEAIPRALR